LNNLGISLFSLKMGASCSSIPRETDAVELLPSFTAEDAWKFLHNRDYDKRAYLTTAKGHTRFAISFTDNTLKIYDNYEDLKATAKITEFNDDGFTLTATFNYVVRQTVYATPTIIRPKTYNFSFSLKDDVKRNLQIYGYRTKVGMYEKGHIIEYFGLH